MAVGDAAAAKGLDLVADTDELNEGAVEINRTRDYIAAEIDARAAAVALKLDASKVIISATEPVGQADGGIWISWV